MNILYRKDITPFESLTVDGKNYSLGEYRPIPVSNELGKQFSFSWVSLNSKQILENHWHNIESTIIIYKGSGMSTGTDSIEVKKGSIIHVPPMCYHGFIPLSNGFEGFSFQSIAKDFILDHSEKSHTSFEKVETCNNIHLKIDENLCTNLKISKIVLNQNENITLSPLDGSLIIFTSGIFLSNGMEISAPASLEINESFQISAAMASEFYLLSSAANA